MSPATRPRPQSGARFGRPATTASRRPRPRVDVRRRQPQPSGVGRLLQGLAHKPGVSRGTRRSAGAGGRRAGAKGPAGAALLFSAAGLAFKNPREADVHAEPQGQGDRRSAGRRARGGSEAPVAVGVTAAAARRCGLETRLTREGGCRRRGGSRPSPPYSPSRTTSPVSGSTRDSGGLVVMRTSIVPSGATPPARTALALPSRPALTR